VYDCGLKLAAYVHVADLRHPQSATIAIIVTAVRAESAGRAPLPGWAQQPSEVPAFVMAALAGCRHRA
jgi:hypothetical protein